MKLKDIRQLSDPELEKLQHDTVEELGKLPFQKAIFDTPNVPAAVNLPPNTIVLLNFTIAFTAPFVPLFAPEPIEFQP